MLKLRILFISAVTLICSISSVLADAYKWVDSAGNTIYSQTPPPEGTPFEVVEDRNVATSNANNSSRTENIQKRLDNSRQAREEKKSEQQRLAESNQIKQENCKRAQDNLTALTSRGQVSINEDGLYRKLTEEERQERIQTAQSNIEEFCN